MKHQLSAERERHFPEQMTPASSLRTQLWMSQPAWEHRARDRPLHPRAPHLVQKNAAGALAEAGPSGAETAAPQPSAGTPPAPNSPPTGRHTPCAPRLQNTPRRGQSTFHYLPRAAQQASLCEKGSPPAPAKALVTGVSISLTPVITRQKLLSIKGHPGSQHRAKPSSADISGLPDLGLLSPFYQGGGNRVRTGTLARPGSSRGSGVIHLTAAGLVGDIPDLLCSFQKHFPLDPPIPLARISVSKKTEALSSGLLTILA